MTDLRVRKNSKHVYVLILSAFMVLGASFLFSNTWGRELMGSREKEAESSIDSRYRSDDMHATVVYFLLFGTQTVAGVTPQTIEESNDYVIRFSKKWPLQSPFPRYEEHSFVKHLRTQLVATKGTNRIDKNFIRLKVKFPESILYVDERGIVWKEGTNNYFLLTHEQMKDLTTTIESFAGVVDQKAVGKR